MEEDLCSLLIGRGDRHELEDLVSAREVPCTNKNGPALKPSPPVCKRSLSSGRRVTRNREAILRLFRVSHSRAAAYEIRDAIFPGYQAPIVRKAADGERELVVLNWGFVLLQKEKAPKRVTNIRDDKAQRKFWKPSFEQRRCLVPASSYCEPKGEKPATWHWFSINGDDARPSSPSPVCGRATEGR